MSMCGRPRKYATDSAKKRAQAELKRNRPPAKVYIGKAMSLWIQTKVMTGIETDAAFAKCLIDRLVLCYYSASTIFTLV